MIQKLERMEEPDLPWEEVQQVEREHWDLPDVRRRVISRLLKKSGTQRRRSCFGRARSWTGNGLVWSPGTARN